MARRLVIELLPFGVITVVYLGIRFGPMKTPVAYAQYPGGTFGATLMGLPAIWAHDLRLLVWPWPLCADYTGYFRFGAQPLAPVLLVERDRASLTSASSSSPSAAASGWSRWGWAGFFWRCSPSRTCCPSPSRPPSGSSTCHFVGSRWRPRPGSADSWRVIPPPARRRGTLLGVGLLTAFAVLLTLRHGDWHDDQRLWLATVAVNPRSCGAQSAVGGGLLSRGMASGDPELAARLGGARRAGPPALQR